MRIGCRMVGCHRPQLGRLNVKNLLLNFLSVVSNRVTDHLKNNNRLNNTLTTSQTIKTVLTIIFLHFYLTLLNLIICIHTKGIVYKDTCSHMLYLSTISYHGQGLNN